MTTLNENQLSRLRLILKPFMLRRVKAEVEHEITEKVGSMTVSVFACPPNVVTVSLLCLLTDRSFNILSPDKTSKPPLQSTKK